MSNAMASSLTRRSWPPALHVMSQSLATPLQRTAACEMRKRRRETRSWGYGNDRNPLRVVGSDPQGRDETADGRGCTQMKKWQASGSFTTLANQLDLFAFIH